MTLAASMNLPARWRGRPRFTVLLDAFGDGEAFAALWAAWRADPQRCERLDVIALAPAPVNPAAFAGVLSAASARLGPLPAEAWPPCTPDLHRLCVDHERVQLLLAIGDPRRAWRELVAQVDAFHLSEAAADAVSLPKAMVRLAAPDATVTCVVDTDTLRSALRARGFALVDASARVGSGTEPMARYRPAFVPSRAPVRRVAAASSERHALIIGAGLAGAATALALAQQGWRSTVIDRHTEPACDASGNPAGLFHGIVNADDGPHARFNRAASFEARRAVQRAIDAHGVPGSTAGLLRLEEAATSPDAMRALLARLGLGPDYVQALDAPDARRTSGLPLQQPAWFYPQGGWVQPGGLVRAMLADAAPHATFEGGRAVVRIARDGTRWRAFDAAGAVLGESEVLVLANAQGALPLSGHTGWPLQPVRGQLSLAHWSAERPAPRLPVAGGGYVMPPVDGHLVFGATAQADDMDPAVRTADHLHNLAQLARILGGDPGIAADTMAGRTAWRCVSDDRLPLIGEVPDVAAGDVGSIEQARFVPRRRGLFVFTALGSRGITWCALGGQVLASAITGAPAPLSASLLDAVDPARFFARAARRASASG